MGLIKATPEDLQTLSGTVQAKAGDIQNDLTYLKGQIASIVGTDWMGQAANKFNDLYNQWQTSASGLQKALEGISQLLANAGKGYADAEAAITGMMG